MSGSNYGKQQLVLASAHVWTDSVASDNHCPEGGAEGRGAYLGFGCITRSVAGSAFALRYPGITL